MAKGTGQLLKVLLVVLGIAAWPQLGLLAFCAGQVSRNPCLLPRPSPKPLLLVPPDCLLRDVCVCALYLLLAGHGPWNSCPGPPHCLPPRPPATAD